MSVYQARAELDKSRKKLNRMQWRLDEGPGFLQGWYRARYQRLRIVWEFKRLSWEEAVAAHKEAIGMAEEAQHG